MSLPLIMTFGGIVAFAAATTAFSAARAGFSQPTAFALSLVAGGILLLMIASM